jgi:hypothetical protein
MLNNLMFLEALAARMPDDQRLLMTTVPGDPEAAGAELWNVKPWFWGTRPPPATNNNYVCVSSFTRGPDGWRRRAEQFGAGLAFMVDDLGTKIPLEPLMSTAQPTALVETSPGNFQAWYMLADPITRYDEFAALLSAFIHRWAGGKDPGMGGPNRVGRMPEGINGKPKYNGWQCRTAMWNPERRWGKNDLIRRLGLVLQPPKPVFVPGHVTEADRAARQQEFDTLVAAMEGLSLFRKPRWGHNNRRPITCPWHLQHTNGATSGTYVTQPTEKNGWWGSYVCYHAGTHNDQCRLGDLKAWVHERIDAALEENLEQANDEHN